MAHAAGAPDLDVEIFGVAPDCLADRLAEGEAARPRRHGVLHDIDGEGDDLARPRVDLAEYATQWHREAVVDVDLVDHGQVEILLNHLGGDVRGKLRMADDLRYRARPIAFVRRVEFRARHDRESGDHLETEGGGVIVVDEEDHVGRMGLLPLLGEVVSSEHRFPVKLLRLSEIEGRADGGNVRGIEGGSEASHVPMSLKLGEKPGDRQSFRGRWASPSSPILRLPSILRPPLTIIARYSSSVMPVIEPAICWKLLPSVAPIFDRK